jgi:hypothetical protein
MNFEKKMTIIFQDIILDINIVHVIKGIVTDISDESICVMLENNKFMIFPTQSLLEIAQCNEYENY